MPSSFRAATTAPRPLESRNSTSLMSQNQRSPPADGGACRITAQPSRDLRKPVLELDRDRGVDPLGVGPHDADTIDHMKRQVHECTPTNCSGITVATDIFPIGGCSPHIERERGHGHGCHRRGGPHPDGRFSGGAVTAQCRGTRRCAISASIVDAGARASDVDEVLMGCVLPAGQGQAPARQAGFLAGLAKMCRPPRSTRCAARA
jgi:hypothetical protein